MKTSNVHSYSRFLRSGRAPAVGLLGLAGLLALSSTAAAAEPAGTASAAETPVVASTPAPTPATAPAQAAPAPAAPALAATTEPAPPATASMEPQDAEPMSDDDDDDDEPNYAHRKARRLAITGYSMLGSVYAASILMGAIAIDVGAPEWGVSMMVPVAGPFVAAGYAITGTGSVTAGMGTLAIGAVQVAGLTMGIVGTRRARRLKNVSLAATPTRGGGHVAMRWRF